MKKNALLIIFTIALSYSYAQPYNFEWAKTIWAYSTSQPFRRIKTLDVIVDNVGNVYSVGYFEDSVDFDPGVGEVIRVSAGMRDCFVQKLDADGNFLWVETFGGTMDDGVESIDIDANGDIIITGCFSSYFSFGALSLFTTYPHPDAFVIKMHSSGNYIWSKRLGIKKTSSIYFDSSVRNIIKSKSDGSIILAGSFYDTTDFVGLPNLIYNGGLDFFVLELTSSGGINWAKSVGGSKNEILEDIDIDDQGNIYIAGAFRDTVDFDPDSGVNEVVGTSGVSTFITKWNSSGNLAWVKAYDLVRPSGLILDHSNNLVFGGRMYATIEFDSLGTTTQPFISNGNSDCLLFKIDSSGNYLWAKSFGGQNSDDLQSVDVDAFNNIFIMGRFSGTVDFDPSPNIDYFFSLDDTDDFFVGQFSPNGTVQAVRTIESNGVDGNSKNSIIRVDGNNNFYLSGIVEDSIDADLESGVFNTSNGLGYHNNFLIKHSNPFASIEENQFSDVSIFPNPTNGIINIQFGETQSAQIRVVNINGQLIYREEINNQDIHSFKLVAESGIYFVEITNENSRKVIKIVIE